MGQSGVALPGHIGGNVESRYEHRRQRELHQYYDQVVKQTLGADAILVMGPGEAKLELLARMKRVKGSRAPLYQTETAPRLSDAEIAQRLRRFQQQISTPASVPEPPLRRSKPISYGRPKPELVVMVASAGGIEAISRVLASLPDHFPAAVAIVQHRATPPIYCPRFSPDIPECVSKMLKRVKS
jgi:hypothetical protein